MKKEPIDFLLEEFDTATKNAWGDTSAERALYVLLKNHRDVLPKLDGYFHKAFRQVDVVTSDRGTTDTVIWLLLDASKIFWKLAEKYVPNEE